LPIPDEEVPQKEVKEVINQPPRQNKSQQLTPQNSN